MEILQIIWFVLLGVLLAAFLICGGFDFGVGMLMCRFNGDQKKSAMEAIAPFWDGNQVWLITAGGALFAAFPIAYAQILSTVYMPIVLLLALLIFRVAAIEFFLATENKLWKAACAKICCASSFGAMFLFGVALACMFDGRILNASGAVGGTLSLFTPLSIAAGILTIVFCLSEGALFFAIKGGDIKYAQTYTLMLAAVFIVYALLFMIYANSQALPKYLCFGAIILAYVSLSAASRAARRQKPKLGFFLTALFAIFAVSAHAIAAYPYIVAPTELSAGIDIFSASSSLMTLKIMLGVTVVGVPIAIAYFIYAHLI